MEHKRLMRLAPDQDQVTSQLVTALVRGSLVKRQGFARLICKLLSATSLSRIYQEGVDRGFISVHSSPWLNAPNFIYFCTSDYLHISDLLLIERACHAWRAWAFETGM